MSYTTTSFSPDSFSTIKYEKFWDEQRLKRWRPRILIYDHQVETLLHDFNAFEDDNDINIYQANVANAVGSAGSFEISIRDRERNIDRSKVGTSNKVVISIAKFPYGPWYNILSGYTESFNVKRDKWEGLDYTLNGFGSGIILEESITSFKREADRAYFGATYYTPNDWLLRIDNLARELLTTTYHLANNNQISIKDRGNFDLSGIAEIPDVLNHVGVRYQPVSAVLNNLAERGGLFWKVDPYDRIIVDTPAKLHKSTLLKTFTKQDKPTDLALNLAYFAGPWGYTIPISSQSGFGNVLISTSGTQSKLAALEAANGDTGESLHDSDIAQEFPLTTSNMSSISLFIKKVGDWIDAQMSGIITGSKSDGGPDLSNIIASFQQDISSMASGTKKAITMPIIKASKSLPAGSGNAWVVINQTGTDDQNTAIAYSNGTAVAKANKRSCKRQHRDDLPADAEGQPPFVLTEYSPTYMFAIYYDTRVKIVAKDALSAWRYGEVEQFIDLSWTKDFRTVVNTLFTMLEYMAKPKMIFPSQTITIPEPPLEAGDIVSLVDEKAGLTNANRTMVDVLNVNYGFDANNPESALGTRYCDVTVTGLYDFLAVEFGDINFDSDLRFDV